MTAQVKDLKDTNEVQQDELGLMKSAQASLTRKVESLTKKLTEAEKTIKSQRADLTRARVAAATATSVAALASSATRASAADAPAPASSPRAGSPAPVVASPPAASESYPSRHRVSFSEVMPDVRSVSDFAQRRALFEGGGGGGGAAMPPPRRRSSSGRNLAVTPGASGAFDDVLANPSPITRGSRPASVPRPASSAEAMRHSPVHTPPPSSS